MHEDEAYRTSSQYRYWSYTPEALASLRQSTNDAASEHVRAAMRRSRYANSTNIGVEQSNASKPAGKMDDINTETLTVQEELYIVRFGCSKIIEMGDVMEPPIPHEIRATAIQYLRRFYLSNSPMTYNPKQIMMCALFLATKSDHWSIALHRFVSELKGTTEDDVKAPEFLLMQGLRFTLDVRHPMRGLEGGIGEILAMLDDGSLRISEKDKHATQKRVGEAAQRANTILLTAAQMTDAYFLYTPSQIWLAALQVADHDLLIAYISKKLEHVGVMGYHIQEKLLRTLSSCADLLASYKSPDGDPAEKKEERRIGKKLHLCQNPEKIDLVAVTRAKAAEKREGADGSDREKALKKRRTEREHLEKDGDVFGPDLKSVSG